jgi:spore coat polysaccharide biosynthesis predicted glycosyltransferase SpsG
MGSPNVRVDIWTEGGAAFGFGHVSRCVAIADALAEHGSNAQFWVCGDDAVQGLVGQHTVQYAPWHNAIPAIAVSDLAIVDSYCASLPALQALAQLYQGRVLWVDDYQRLNYPPGGWLLNYDFRAPQLGYMAIEHRLLLGPEYIPLRKPFWHVPVKRLANKRMERVLVTFGGVPQSQLYNRVLAELAHLAANIRQPLHVNVLPGRTQVTEIQLPDSALLQVKFLPAQTAEKIQALYATTDLAITAGGVTLLELAATRTPALVIVTAENQYPGASALHQMGAVHLVGRMEDSQLRLLFRKGLEQLSPASTRQQLIAAAEAVTDGQGARRITQALLATR